MFIKSIKIFVLTFYESWWESSKMLIKQRRKAEGHKKEGKKSR